MSTATAPRPSVPGRSTSRPVNRPPVRAVQPSVIGPARAPFVVLVLVLLALGLGALLLLNTLLAQGSFTLQSLDTKVADLANQEQALQQRAAKLASPIRLARGARELGMVPTVNPAFLRTEDGKILGAPVPAASPPAVVGSEAEAETPPDTQIDTQDKPANQDKPAQDNGPAQNQQGDGGADR